MDEGTRFGRKTILIKSYNRQEGLEGHDRLCTEGTLSVEESEFDQRQPKQLLLNII